MNEIFLRATNYQLTDIKGRHHRFFVAGDYVNRAASVEEQSLLMESLSTNSDELLQLTDR